MSGGKRGSVVVKQKWTEEEEAALRAGVEKYEAGKWRHIQKDTELGPILKNRSNVDLKDKWRNLNMESGSSRRDSRGGGDKSGKRRRKKRTEKFSDTGAEDEDADYVAGREPASYRPRRMPRRRYTEEPETSQQDPPEHEPEPEPEAEPEPEPEAQVAEVTEENVLAAMIQLQSQPDGASADTICEWLEENYGVAASGKRSVRWKLKQMMEAGRLTQEDGLYKFAGVPQQIMEDSKRWAKKKTAREAAEAAARAVQEAEEAAVLATELIARADRFDQETGQTVDQDDAEVQ